MPTLHLIDAASAQARPTTLALMAATVRAQRDAQVLLLGGTALGAVAEAAGLVNAQRIGVPLRRAELGLPALHRALRAAERQRSGALDVIFAWSAGALRAVRWLRANVPCVACVVQSPDATMMRAIRQSRAGYAKRGQRFAVAALDPVIGQAVGAEAVPEQMGIVSPAFHPGPGEAEHMRWRRVLRERWRSEEPGRTAGNAGEFVVALLSDPPEAADARQALLAVGLARETLAVQIDAPPNVAVLVHPTQHERTRAEQTALQVETPVRLIQDAGLAAPWRVLPGCDAALSLGQPGRGGADAGGLSLAAAMAAGVPIVAPDTARHRLSLTHEQTALLASSDEPRRLAIQLQRLILSPALGADLAAAARRRAEAGDVTGWVATVNTAAERAIHGQVESPAQPPPATLATAPAKPLTPRSSLTSRMADQPSDAAASAESA